ncbi:pyrroline-5-carboxylate reductase [Pseudomonas sp. SP16.1]|uniref:pyrroline-5-carboxylate reductase n=1 Tax=Pseudomonas sp. SP16.1 TaxID=3458854 RepID=UPI0040462D52
MNALFIGYGRMGSAIGAAWLEAKLVDSISAVVRNPRASTSATLYPSLQALPQQPFDLIVVATKPAQVCAVLADLPDALCAGSLVISVAAGVTSASLEQALRRRCPVVRVMPNTAVLTGAGCTGLYAAGDVSSEQRACVARLFDAIGKAYWVEDEDQLDAVTALSGSGLAYYHLFSEALANAGAALGLPAELAKALAAQTAFGAASQQIQAGADFVELRTAVTSPNGTTAAAIAVFEQDRALRRLVEAAAQAAQRRSQELSQGA